MKQRWILAIGLVCSAAVFIPAKAEPTPKIERFMNTQVSLFSFGLFRLQLFLNEVLYQDGGALMRPPLPSRMKYLTSAKYDWDQNRLVISAYRFAFKDSTSWNLEEECTQVIGYLRTYLGVSDTTGKPTSGIASSLGEFFSPMGYSLTMLKDENFTELDTITRIRFYTLAEQDSKIECEAPLLGKGFSVVKGN